MNETDSTERPACDILYGRKNARMESTAGPIFRLPDADEAPSREDLARAVDNTLGAFRAAFGAERWEIVAAEHLLRQAAEHAPYVGEERPADERRHPTTSRPPPSSEEATEPVEVAARCRGLAELRGLPPEIAGALRDAAGTVERLLSAGDDESERRIPGIYKEIVLVTGAVVPNERTFPMVGTRTPRKE